MKQEKTSSPSPQLNLARSWRPKTFDQIIGQDLSIRMLKNGLYLEKLFPVYLFAGQRGCGKTSTARVFAAAINCENVAQWRKKPTDAIPCMKCTSCINMSTSQHPDFIEMDAASHTGVDDVRQLTESASYMPLVSPKKIYLIDEAHMLSKAAFNAFLKILEEPPATVHFILATTELLKIPETVRSRCFQVVFNPVGHNAVIKQLTAICTTENIPAEPDGLQLIAQETDGSVRDAINLLEKVRFLDATITRELVLESLGKVSEQTLYELFALLIEKQPKKVLTFLEKIAFHNCNPTLFWYSLNDLVRALMRIKFGAPVSTDSFFRDTQTLKKSAELCSINRLHAIVQLLWNHEELFTRTHQKHHFVEMVLIQISRQVAVKDLHELLQLQPINSPTPPTQPRTTQKSTRASAVAAAVANSRKSSTTPADEPTSDAQLKGSSIEKKNPEIAAGPWKNVVSAVEQLNDNLLTSFFKQMRVETHDQEGKTLTLSLARKNSFFLEKIKESEKMWLPIVQKHYGEIKISFVQIADTTSPTPTPRAPSTGTPPQAFTPPPSPSRNGPPEGYRQNPPARRAYGQNSFNQRKPVRKAVYLDTSDTEKWPKAHLIASTFSTKIEKLESGG